MRKERRKEICDALNEIEEEYFRRLLKSYEELREEEFWDTVESLNQLLGLISRTCEGMEKH
jgi:hypothetical protein